MLVHQFDVRRTAGGGHESLTFGYLFKQFMSFLLGGFHGTFGYFEHIVEAHQLKGAIHLFDAGAELTEDGRSDASHHLFTLTDALQHVEHLRDAEDSAERTSVHTLATIDALAFVDVLDAAFVLADGLHRAGFFAWHGDVNDGMIRTALVANAAAHARVVVNPCLTSLGTDVDSALRTVILTMTGRTATAKVGNFVIDLDASRAGFIHHTHNFVFRFTVVGTVHRHLGVFG